MKGFTLLEVIIVMILSGIIAAAVFIGYVQVVKGMFFTKMNAATIQKGQITITKLVKEFSNIKINSISAASDTSITFTTVKNGVTSPNTTVTVSGSTITFGGDVLTDQVSSFSLKYYDNYDSAGQTTWQSSRRIIEITLKLTGADGVISEFKARVRPRNL
ncbi:MAG: prepilin-type N-terminal cleavage/methylation domain-containing protein [Smithella sp.]